MLNVCLKWCGALFGVVGGSIIALNTPEITKYAFIVLTFSAVCWVVYGYRIKENSLIVLNLTFIVVNLFGIYNWMV